MGAISVNSSSIPAAHEVRVERGVVVAQQYQPLVHGLAVLLTCWAYLVVCIGGLVKSREAGLSIPQGFIVEWHFDWLFIQNLQAEYGHRVLVGVMSGLTLLLVLSVFLKERRKSVQVLAGFLVVGLVAQAFLGYLTVTYFAHARTSIPHAVLGQIFLCMAVSMAAVTSRRWLSNEPALLAIGNPGLSRLAIYAIAAVGVQLLLGAALRHDDEGLGLRTGRSFVFVWHLIAHVVGAFSVIFFIGRLISRVFRQHREQDQIFKPVKYMMMLLGVQFLLGPGAAALKVLTIDEYNNPPFWRVVTATTHLAIGAAILALCVLVSLRAYRFVKSEVPSAAAGGGLPA